jgi:hypothetical protein
MSNLKQKRTNGCVRDMFTNPQISQKHQKQFFKDNVKTSMRQLDWKYTISSLTGIVA